MANWQGKGKGREKGAKGGGKEGGRRRGRERATRGPLRTCGFGKEGNAHQKKRADGAVADGEGKVLLERALQGRLPSA